MTWENPKTDWVQNPKNPKAEDFNRIEGNIEVGKNEIEDKKGGIVDALNEVGINSNINDTYNQLSNKIINSERKNVVITPTVSDVNIPEGIYNTSGGYVKGDTNLVSQNIVKGKKIFNVIGNAEGPYFEIQGIDLEPDETYTLPFEPDAVFVTGRLGNSTYGVTGAVNIHGEQASSRVDFSSTSYGTLRVSLNGNIITNNSTVSGTRLQYRKITNARIRAYKRL